MANIIRIENLLSKHNLLFNKNHATSRIIGILEEQKFSYNLAELIKAELEKREPEPEDIFIYPRAIIYSDKKTPTYLDENYKFPPEVLKDILEAIPFIQQDKVHIINNKY